MGQLAKYSYTNAKIRAMASSLLDDATWIKLKASRDAAEIVEILKATPYRELATSLEGPDQLETELLKNNVAMHRKVVEAMTTKTEKKLVETLLERYEIEQLKTALRIWHKQAPVDLTNYLYAGRIRHSIDFKKIAHAPSYEEIVFQLGGTPYVHALIKTRDRYQATGALFYIEVALDMDYYYRLEDLVEDLSKTDQKMAKTILGVEIDIENIHWLIRLRKYYSLNMGEILDWVIPGGARITKESMRKLYVADGLSELAAMISPGPYAPLKELLEDKGQMLEQFLHEILNHQVKRAMAGFPFTIGTILGYLDLKQDETACLISLLYAKKFGWQKENIETVIAR